MTVTSVRALFLALLSALAVALLLALAIFLFAALTVALLLAFLIATFAFLLSRLSVLFALLVATFALLGATLAICAFLGSRSYGFNCSWFFSSLVAFAAFAVLAACKSNAKSYHTSNCHNFFHKKRFLLVN